MAMSAFSTRRYVVSSEVSLNARALGTGIERRDRQRYTLI